MSPLLLANFSTKKEKMTLFFAYLKILPDLPSYQLMLKVNPKYDGTSRIAPNTLKVLLGHPSVQSHHPKLAGLLQASKG